MYEKLFRHVLFPAYETLKRRGTLRHIAEYRQSQWLDPSALARLQLRKLNTLLAYCWEHVPYLQSHWRAAGLRPGEIGQLSDLAHFPTLSKAQITANYEGMVAGPWRGRTLGKLTSGSTGEPFRCEYTMDVYARRTAIMWRGYGWGGATLGTRTAYVWGTGMRESGIGGLKDRLYHAAFNRSFFNALNLSEANIDTCIAAIRRYRPTAMVGYVAPVTQLARRLLETGDRLTGLRGVLTGAEALHGSERREIESAFGCPAFDTYGSREVMLMASECEQHRGLHVNADHLLLEILGADGTPLAPGESGAVAVTDFHNFGMPLVRYLNGDAACFSSSACACGRGLPLLQRVDGRVLDLVRTPEGRLVPGEFFVKVFLDIPAVRQWQVVQTALDRLQLRLVANPLLTPEQCDQLRQSVLAELGSASTIEILAVDSIASTPSGKRRLTVAYRDAGSPGA